MSSVTESSLTEAQDMVSMIKKSYLKMLVYTTGVVILAVILAHLLNTYYRLGSVWILLLEYIGYVCWGTTLGTLGTKIVTWDSNKNTAELFDQKLSMIFSMLGIFAFVMARALEPLIKLSA